MSRLKVTAAFCLIGVINQAALAQSANSERVRPIYRAGRIPDPPAAHRVALALGEGKQSSFGLIQARPIAGTFNPFTRHSSRFVSIAAISCSRSHLTRWRILSKTSPGRRRSQS